MNTSNTELSAQISTELALVQRRRKALQTANVALQHTRTVKAAREALSELTGVPEVAADALAIIDAMTGDTEPPASSAVTGQDPKMAFAADLAGSLNLVAAGYGLRQRCTAGQVHALLLDYLADDPAHDAQFEKAFAALLVTREVPQAARHAVSAGQ